jgi:hypothetical protein
VLSCRPAMATEVTVALITGGFGVLVAMIGKLSRDNRRDHGQVQDSLDRIETKLDDHLEGHP